MTTTTLSPLVTHLWQSTLFVVMAALLALALRTNRAHLRYSIWLIASLKFLVPFSLLIAIGSRIHWPASVPASHPEVAAVVKDIAQPFSVPTTFLTTSIPAVTTANPVPTIALALWLCGVLVVLFSWSKRWLRIRATVNAATPLPLEIPIRTRVSSTLLEPGVFGVFRPVLLLPEGITNHLAPAHLEAILAHELCHVRRRDNSTAAIHMLVEALFWFHPLVWWIGSRLIEERERACDEEVLRLGSEPNVYAESILKTCQFYLESPLVCVSGITGADLKKRIIRIMTRHASARLNISKKFLLATAAAIAVALPIASGLVNGSESRAQTSSTSNTPSFSFEVASIKPSKPGSRLIKFMTPPGGRFSAEGLTVKFLLEEAYGVKDSQISGAPAWFDSERYDIEAKATDSVGSAIDKLPPKQRKEELMQMLQSLLSDRLKLQLSHETRQLKIDALVVAKGHPKLQPSSFKPSDHPRRLPPVAPGGAPPPGGFMMGPGHFTSTGVDLPTFANMLSRVTGRAIVDKTGLTGRYDFTLQWTPEEGQGPMPPREAAPSGPDGPGQPESSGPSLVTALQEQLGLKLEPQKAPMDVLVIQHVERPTEN